MPPPKGERRFYPALRKWLGKKGYYTGEGTYEIKGGRRKTAWFSEKGVQGQIADVVGVKNVGQKYFDDLEVVIIEVRDSERIKVRDLQDARGYAALSHLTYLAHTAEPSEDKIGRARNLGIGLIHIVDRKHFREILSPSRNDPNERAMAGFLDNLNIAQCSLCRCYFFTWSSWYDSDGEKHGKTYVELNRIKQFNWVHDDPDETNPFEIVERRMKVEATYKTRRYLCINCVKELSAISADKAQV